MPREIERSLSKENPTEYASFATKSSKFESGHKFFPFFQ
jgi:hypothetical protein